jgi:CheY-like chemotaxis protein
MGQRVINSGRFHIVVLEDNQPDLLMIRQSIREAGLDCEILAFADGAEALMYVKGSSSPVPDLMILDFNVPEVEGASVLNSVRGSPRWADVGVLMFTASQDPGDAARVKMLGADDCRVPAVRPGDRSTQPPGGGGMPGVALCTGVT